jgi:serine/threonine-protein kinase HipA
MPSDLEGYVYVLPPGSTELVTAGRFSQSRDRQDQPVGTFVDGRSYRERADPVELDPVQLRLRQGPFETARLGGCFGALRDALPDH